MYWWTHPQFAVVNCLVVGAGSVAREYVDGIEDEERTAGEGGSLFVPAGTVHWFRNGSDAESSFVCMGPNGDAGIEPVGE